MPWLDKLQQLNKLLLPFLLLASGCAASSGDPVRTTAALTPIELIRGIDAHTGRTVTVEGYFTYVVDTRALWENKKAHRDADRGRQGSWDKCVTIYPTNGDVRRFNGRRVQITGKATVVEKDDIRSLWTCNPVALEDAVIAPG